MSHLADEGRRAIRLNTGPSHGPPKLPYDVLLNVFAFCGARQHHREPWLEHQAAADLAQELAGYCFVARDWRHYFQPKLWREVTIGDVADADVRATVASFLQTAREKPALASAITALRIVKPFRPPAGPKSQMQVDLEMTLGNLCRALPSLRALETVTLRGTMVADFASMPPEDVPPKLTTVTLSGPPSDSFLGLRNLSTVSSLHLDHPWLATPAFLDRVHIQLANLTSLRIDHFALSPSHPTLAFLLGGAFGKHLTELSVHLTPDCPSPLFPNHLLRQAPNLTYLSLTLASIDITSLPALPNLEVLHLHDSGSSWQDTDQTRVVLRALAQDRADAERRPRMSKLQAVEIDIPAEKVWPGSLVLGKVGLKLLGLGHGDE